LTAVTGASRMASDGGEAASERGKCGAGGLRDPTRVPDDATADQDLANRWVGGAGVHESARTLEGEGVVEHTRSLRPGPGGGRGTQRAADVSPLDRPHPVREDTRSKSNSCGARTAPTSSPYADGSTSS